MNYSPNMVARCSVSLEEMILSSMHMWYLVELESQWWYDYQGAKTVGYMILS